MIRFMEGILLRKAAENVARVLSGAGHTVYFVGGCVRDRLLGYSVKDIDIATSARPDEVLRLFPDAWEVGAAFGVVLVRREGFSFEVATFRRDGSYRDGRRPEAVCFTDAEEDSRRRDFTMNGLFEDPFSSPPGRVVDYVGGVEDIRARVLRCIGEPDRRFEEDSLRLMRAVRFAVTREVQVETETCSSIFRNAPLLARISPERIREELDRILLSPGRKRGVEMLVETGLMKHVIPEIYDMIGCTQPPQWHPEGDVYTHTLMMLDALGRDGSPVSLELALGVLLHDIGKPPCRQVDETGRIRFSGHDKEGSSMARVILRRLKYSNAVVDAVCSMVERHMRFINVRQMRKSTLRMFMNAPHFRDELELHRLDCLSSNGLMDNWQFVRDFMDSYRNAPLVPPPLVTGRDLVNLGLSPGPDFGKWLSRLQELQLEGTLRTREEALLQLGQIAPVEQNALAEYLKKLAL